MSRARNPTFPHPAAAQTKQKVKEEVLRPHRARGVRVAEHLRGACAGHAGNDGQVPAVRAGATATPRRRRAGGFAAVAGWPVVGQVRPHHMAWQRRAQPEWAQGTHTPVVDSAVRPCSTHT